MLEVISGLGIIALIAQRIDHNRHVLKDLKQYKVQYNLV